MIDWLSQWRRFCALMVAIFLVRAAFVMSILPPFEGWDEYQHLAYIVFLAENDRAPVLGSKDVVPESLYPSLVQYPHCQWCIDQVRCIGALTYDEFWQSSEPPNLPDRVCSLPLYQAQQAPLYYRLATPVYRALSGADNAVALMTVLRAINVLLVAAALYVALAAIGGLVKHGPHRYAIGLLAGLQPLFLLNSVRVANDALAVLLGTLVIVILLRLPRRRYWLWVVLGGFLLGFAILAKTINLAMVPFVVFVFGLLWFRKKLSAVRASLGGVVMLLSAAAVTYQYFHFNVVHFGMLTPLQEAVMNREAGKGVGDMAVVVLEADWWRSLANRYFRYSLWHGGWSSLQLPSFIKTYYQYNLYLAIFGCVFALSARVRRGRLLFKENTNLFQAGVLCLSVAAALGYHAVQTRLALGAVATNAWYAAACFPWLLCLYCQFLAFYPGRWIARLLLGEMLLLFAVADLYGVFGLMVPAYAGASWGALARSRLGALHLPGLGPELTVPSAVLVCILAALAVAVWMRNDLRDETPTVRSE
jgi:hypothetical protein